MVENGLVSQLIKFTMVKKKKEEEIPKVLTIRTTTTKTNTHTRKKKEEKLTIITVYHSIFHRTKCITFIKGIIPILDIHFRKTRQYPRLCQHVLTVIKLHEGRCKYYSSVKKVIFWHVFQLIF